LNNHRSTVVHSCNQTGLVISIALVITEDGLTSRYATCAPVKQHCGARKHSLYKASMAPSTALHF
jgi:hypothetical protein